jgi:hypothetical protein
MQELGYGPLAVMIIGKADDGSANFEDLLIVRISELCQMISIAIYLLL